ncbi:MAG: hypothetical protein V4582_22180 [Pseudomonadota bacterium]
MLPFIALLVALFAGLHLAALILVVSRLLRLPLWAPLSVPAAREKLGEMVQVLDLARALLEHHGFRYQHSQQVRSLAAIDGVSPGCCDFYYHAGHDVHAQVNPAEIATVTGLFSIHLWNVHVDDSVVVTVNGVLHALTQAPRRIRIGDARAADFAAHLAAHLAARDAIAAQRCSCDDAILRAAAFGARLLPELQEQGVVYQRGMREGEAVYAYRFKAAVAAAWRLRRGAARKAIKPIAEAVAPTPEQVAGAQQAYERNAFVRTLCTLRGLSAPRWFRWTTFAFSGAAFLALGAWLWGWAGALTIGAVIAVHEGGHWLAMKLAGFRDVQVFFVPGMGGATSGEKHEATPLTHLLVYLAGPVPGMLLALAGFALTVVHPDWLAPAWHARVMIVLGATLFINWINLLPVLPLDGGRVIELLVIARLPWMRLVFMLASVGLILGAGFALGDNVLRGFGVLMLIGLPQQYRIAKAAAALKREKWSTPAHASDHATQATHLYDFLSQTEFKGWKFQTRLSIARALMPRFLASPPNWKEGLIGASAYLACLLAPAIVWCALMIGAPDETRAAFARAFSSRATAAYTKPTPAQLAAQVQTQRNRRAHQLARAVGPARAQGFRDALDDAYEEGDDYDALCLARLYYKETGGADAHLSAHADAALALSDALDVDEHGVPDTQSAALRAEAEQIVRARLAAGVTRADATLLARIRNARVARSDSAATLAMLREIAQLYATCMEKGDDQLIDARTALAQALLRFGQTEQAERELRAAITDLPPASDADTRAKADRLATDLAWLMLASGRAQKAMEVMPPLAAASSQHTRGDDNARRESHAMRWLAARQLGDMPAALQQARAMGEVHTPASGNALLNFLTGRSESPDFRTELIIIDTQRATGDAAAADIRLARFRKMYAPANAPSKAPTNTRTSAPPALACRMHVSASNWRAPLQQTLADIERRELRCTP